MSTYKGRLFLVKAWLGTANTSNVAQSTPVLYARTADMSLSVEQVDTSTKATNGWRELGTDMGLKNLTLSCEGIHNNTAVEIVLAERAANGNVAEYMIVSESGNYWKGPFQINEYNRSGTYNEAETFSITLSSAGVITFANTGG